jgi:hypothetical protein
MAFSFQGCRIAKNVPAAVSADREVQQSVRVVTALLQLPRINALCRSDPVLPVPPVPPVPPVVTVVTVVTDFSIDIAVVGEFRPRNQAVPGRERQRYCILCEHDISQWAVSIPFSIRR